MEEDKERKLKKDLNNYGRYMGAGFQILGTILFGFLMGWLLDKYVFHFTKPIFTMILSVLMIFVALYQLIRQFMKP